jgi:hypothetical protein
VTYEEALSTLKVRLHSPPGEKGSHVRAMEVGASLISGTPYREPDYHTAEIKAGLMIHAMWASEPKAAPHRRWPQFRAGTYGAIVADSPVGQYDDHRNTSYFEGYLVACGFENIALRDFIIAACNAYAEPAAEPEEPWGWYAGPKAHALTIGPLPTREAAFERYRFDHGAEAFFLVEGRKQRADLSPFRWMMRLQKVFDWVNSDNAGFGGALPPISDAQADDLADMLNATLRAWGRKHRIIPISTAIEARKIEHVPEVRRRSVSECDRFIGLSIDEIRAKVRAEGDPTPTRSDFPPNPPARPHTGDMVAMVDDLSRAA